MSYFDIREILRQDRVGNHYVSTIRYDGDGLYETGLFLIDGTELEITRNPTREKALQWHADVLASLEAGDPLFT